MMLLLFILNVIHCEIVTRAQYKVSEQLSLDDIGFSQKLSLYDAEMKIREKVLSSRSENEKNIIRLYKAEMYKELINRKPISHNNFLSFAQLKLKRAPNQKENINNFFSDIKNYNIIKKIDDIPKSGTASIEPWSSSWWPIMNGQTSVRYNKNARMNSIGVYDKQLGDFKKKFSYTQSVNSYTQPNDYYKYSSLSKEEFSNEINEVWSPSEKYDLLVGDYNFTYTKAEKSHGQKYMKMYGNVPSWFGYCHGWTPASYMFKRPNRTVTLTAHDGATKINFLPDDIKGLATAFISNSYYYTNFFGSPCNYRTTTIDRDKETGIYIDQECNDIEPGSTLMVLGNIIGRLKKNVGFDPDPDFEIWNQPIRAYKVQYFNLNTNKTYDNVNEAKVLTQYLNTNTNDKFLYFLKKRSPINTHSFVGIFLTIEYVVETELLHKDDESNPDSIRIADYVGGINLDKDNNIIGGEWRYNHHPDFIWRISELRSPSSTYDKYVPSFNGKVSELKKLTQYAKLQSQQKVPLKSIIEYLSNTSYVEPSSYPLYESIIPKENYKSIGNGNPLINWGNGVYTVKSEDNTIIFTGTAIITRTEPSSSYYRYIDPANGVAYYSLNPFVYRIKEYEERDDIIMPDNSNNGNDPQIGAKKLVYCEGGYRYTMTGGAIISIQCPAKGNFYNFVTKKGTTFYSLKSFSVSYGEFPNCNADDYTPGRPNVDIDDNVNDRPHTEENNKIVKVKTNGREYTLSGNSDISKSKPNGSYYMFTLPNGETYYSKETFKVTYTLLNETNNESNDKEIEVRTNGRIYKLKGTSSITRNKPSRGGYYMFTLPNGDTYYSKEPFSVTYTNNNSSSNVSNSNRNSISDYLTNYLNSLFGLSNTNTVSRVFNGRIYTISGQSPISLQQPYGYYYYYDMPNGTRYYSSSPFSVNIS